MVWLYVRLPLITSSIFCVSEAIFCCSSLICLQISLRSSAPSVSVARAFFPAVARLLAGRSGADRAQQERSGRMASAYSRRDGTFKIFRTGTVGQQEVRIQELSMMTMLAMLL